MKRSEIHVGDVLYYAKPGDWDRNVAAPYKGNRVVVVSDKPHQLGSFHPYRPYEVASGSGVLVDFVRETGAAARRDIVQLAHLRGPHDLIVAEVEVRRAAARERADADRTKVNAVRAYVEGVILKARAVADIAVANATRFGVNRAEWAEVSMRADDLVALLDRLAEAENAAKTPKMDDR